MKTQTLKLGTHRGNRRVWLDNKKLLEGSGFFVGARYDVKYQHISQIIQMQLAPEGARKVAKKSETSPIIDLNSNAVGLTLGTVEAYSVEYSNGFISIQPVEEKERSLNELAQAFKSFSDKA
jgi:hypothetical protein